MQISFIITFHPSRINNLNQTLRFLRNRESELLNQELILVCQTSCGSIGQVFASQRQINLGLQFYHKPKMHNVGVEAASGDILIFLDSDRILPPNYFTDAVKLMRDGIAISTLKLYKLDDYYSDEEITLGKITKDRDFRTKIPSGRRKSLFSGNTIITKNDFVSMGGYDESFVGYGFADHDMSMTALNAGLEVIWLDKEELHLKHETKIFWSDQMIEGGQIKIFTAINALRYHLKWKISIIGDVKKLVSEVNSEIDTFPKELQIEFIKMQRKIISL